MEEKLQDKCYPFYESFPNMASLRHRSPQDILADQAKRSVSQPSFAKSKPVDYSQVKSRCGSTNVPAPKPGGGTKKVPTAKLNFSNVESRTSSRHGNYAAGGGGVKIVTKPVKVTHVASRIDSGKQPQRRLSDTPPLLSSVSTIGFSPTSSLTGGPRSKSETSSPDLQRHQIQGQNFTMHLLDHDKVQETIRKLSLEGSRTEEGTSSTARSPSTARKSARKTSAEKAVKLPLGLRRYASSTSSLSRSAERPLDVPGSSKKQLTRHTSLDPSRFKQAVERKASPSHRSLSSSQTSQDRAQDRTQDRTPLRKNASTSMLGSRKTGLSMVCAGAAPGRVSRSVSASSKVTAEHEDRLGRDWVRGGDDAVHTGDVSADLDVTSSSARDIVDAALSQPGPLTAGAGDGDFVDGDFVDGDFVDGDFVDGDFVDGDFVDGDFVAGAFERSDAEAECASDSASAQTGSEEQQPPLLSPIEEIVFEHSIADGL